MVVGMPTRVEQPDYEREKDARKNERGCLAKCPGVERCNGAPPSSVSRDDRDITGLQLRGEYEHSRTSGYCPLRLRVRMRARLRLRRAVQLRQPEVTG
jgi:hypothetical protein